MKRYIFAVATIIICATAATKAQVAYLTTEEFKTKVFDYTKQKEWNYKGSVPCIIDFYTTWCGPCKRLAPIMEELSQDNKGKVYFYKVDTEKEPELATYFGIRSIPTILFCPVGAEPRVGQGLMPKETLQNAINQILLKK